MYSLVEEPQRAKRKRDEFSEWEDYGEEDGEKDEVQRYIDSQFLWVGDDLLSFLGVAVKGLPSACQGGKDDSLHPSNKCIERADVQLSRPGARVQAKQTKPRHS